MAYMDTMLRINGFNMEIRPDGTLYLTTTALAQNLTMGVKDLEELLDSLSECGGGDAISDDSSVLWGFGKPGTVTRPPRLWNILAMK